LALIYPSPKKEPALFVDEPPADPMLSVISLFSIYASTLLIPLLDYGSTKASLQGSCHWYQRKGHLVQAWLGCRTPLWL